MKKVKIKMLQSGAGIWKGEGFSYACGEVVEVDADLARDLCRDGINAVLLTKPAKSTATAKHLKKEIR